MADKKIKVTLVKSTIGAIPKHRATVAALGLKKTGRSNILPDNDAVRGDQCYEHRQYQKER